MQIFDKSFGLLEKGLDAYSTRAKALANNIANVNTTVTENGTPFRRKVVTFQERVTTDFVVPMNVNSEDNRETGNGVRVIGISEDNSPFKYVYDPSHPQANKDGYVEMPNINIISEMTDMITATRAYEANVNIINSAKGMAQAALNIGK